MKIEKNLLSQELIAKLKAFTRDGKQPTQTNFFSYEANIVGFSNAVFGFLLNDELKDELCSQLIEKEVFYVKPKNWVAFIHLFSRASFIPWHDDCIYPYTGAIYLNEVWDKNLGGYFAYEDNDEIKCIVPTYNTGCFFKPPLMHTVTVTAGNAPLRETVQIFVKEF
jgi:hypothetical protein